MCPRYIGIFLITYKKNTFKALCLSAFSTLVLVQHSGPSPAHHMMTAQLIPVCIDSCQVLAALLLVGPISLLSDWLVR